MAEFDKWKREAAIAAEAGRCPDWWMKRLEGVTIGEWHDLCVQFGVRPEGSTSALYNHARPQRDLRKEKSMMQVAWAFHYGEVMVNEAERRVEITEEGI